MKMHNHMAVLHDSPKILRIFGHGPSPQGEIDKNIKFTIEKQKVYQVQKRTPWTCSR